MSFNFMKIAFAWLMILGALNVSAHGEDKEGPHGGFIRMPGAFHTEVVLKNPQSILVYLLDMDWRKPTVQDSQVTVTTAAASAAKKKIEGKCKVQEQAFFCEFPAGVDLTKKGELIVKANREKMQGNEAQYELPLKLKPLKVDHSEHH